jgi:hypothetical protein
LRHVILKMIILPRQDRDIHKENSKGGRRRFLAARLTLRRVEAALAYRGDVETGNEQASTALGQAAGQPAAVRRPHLSFLGMAMPTQTAPAPAPAAAGAAATPAGRRRCPILVVRRVLGRCGTAVFS